MTKLKLILGTMTFGESVFLPDVEKFINEYLDSGYEELDTAYVYNEGNCERLLGEALAMVKKPYKIATKINPRITGRLDAEAAYMQVNESLNRLRRDSVDIVYLHFPDPSTPVLSVLEACEALYEQRKFTELGLSNFPAWMVADVWNICEKKGWVKPSVYQGIYNPLTRRAEVELDACLNRFNMRFYAFNPLAGGILTGRYSDFTENPTDGRFTHRPNYQDRYWKKSYFGAVHTIKESIEPYGISLAEATYRWLANHSMLNADRGDGVLLGASKITHLQQNIKAFNAGVLPTDVVDAFEQAWKITKQDSPEYFTLFIRKKEV